MAVFVALLPNFVLSRDCVATDGISIGGYIGHLEVVTTNNNNAIPDFHTLQITTR
jgi:hypothetical protein